MLLLPALILFAVIKKTTSKTSAKSKRTERRQERTANESAAAAAVDNVCLEAAAVQAEQMFSPFKSTTATVTVDADVDEDITQASAAVESFAAALKAPEIANKQPALPLPPLMSKALVFLMHLVVVFARYALATYTWPFGSLLLLVVALSSPAVINIHKWWNKALDEAIGMDAAAVPVGKVAWDKAWA
jgi:hypothetical protein